MNSKMLLHSALLSACLTLFLQTRTFACGYNYVSNCATTLDISVDGFTSGFQASTCPYLTVFPGHDFGEVTSLNITKLQSITWESCDNFVMDAKFFYRIYPQSGTGGAFTEVAMPQLSTVAAGAYRTRTREGTPNLDLLAGLNAGSYFVEIYFESDVDFNNDSTPDAVITKNNGGSYFKASFTIPSGQGGILSVVLDSQANATCNGGVDGGASVTTTNGTPPYTYAWSNGATGAAIAGVGAGAYTVTATDNDGSTGTLNVLISQPSPLLTNASGQDETSPSANNGTATASPSGGTAPYTFSWSNGGTAATITGLDSGVYGVTVTDAAGCTAAGTVIISVSGSNPTNYCAAKGDFPWVDWITNVKLGDIDNASGKSQYSDFTTASTQLNLGANYSITLENGFSWQTYDEYFKVWIDFDRNGVFEEPGEVAFSGILAAPPLGTPGGITTGTLSVPSTAGEGITRMRVAIKRGAYAQPCETIPFGEVEDYTINLVNGGPVPCSISSIVNGTQCNDNGTSLDPNDDTFMVSVTVNGSGTGTGWTTTIGGQNFTGGYGSPALLGPFDISAGAISFTIADMADATCTTSQNVTPPAPCSTNDPCAISANAGSPNCNDNGTSTDPTDDTYTFSLTVTGTNTGAGWTTTILGQPQSGAYGTPTLMGPFPIAGGNLNFTVSDADDSSCSAPVSVTVPAPCSNGGPGPGYCAVQSGFPWHDWIAGVVLENLDNTSSKAAYSDFTGLSANVQAGGSYAIDLTAGFSWFTDDEHWKVWIDYDQDGTFSEPDEVAFSSLEPAPPNGTIEYGITGTIDIPASALVGATRMRVAMSRNTETGPCENPDFGEVEDYTVVVAPALAGRGTSNLIIDANASMETVELTTFLEVAEGAETWVMEKSADGVSFEPFAEGEINDKEFMAFRQTDVSPFEGQNFYRISLTDRAGNTLSEELATEDFRPLADFEVFPNPTSSLSRVGLAKVLGLEVRIEVSNQLGQPVFRQYLPQAEMSTFELPSENWRDGIYTVTVQAENRRPVTKRLIISRL